jgi:hypothetical protein
MTSARYLRVAGCDADFHGLKGFHQWRIAFGEKEADVAGDGGIGGTGVRIMSENQKRIVL